MLMIRGEKILITGPAGRIAFAIAKTLAPHNEVWGVARFGDPATRQEVEALGVKTRALDLASGSYGDLPKDFTYLLHLAADFSPDDYDRAISVNAEGTGLLMQHCRGARAALIMSTVTVYKPHEDPWHAWREDEPLGDQKVPNQAPYSISKISQEAVARFCARAFGLPTVIARMGSAYGLRGGLPVWHLHAIAQGKPVQTRWDPMVYAPIFDDDIVGQIEPLLGAAGVPANIVNFCGDQAVSVQQWCAYIGELLGVEPVIEVSPVPDASVGSVGDPGKRITITGPCRTSWREGVRRMAEHFYPHRIGKA
jgi:nucleoside-diphosphate-sugar epimerase